MKMPDIKRHYIISRVKSILRIAGYIYILIHIPTAVIVLIISEALGLIEENV